MKKLLLTAVISLGFVSEAQEAVANDNEWGCTVFICAAAPFDPFSIPECAQALLRIRPWRIPRCPAANVKDFETEEVELRCPTGFQLQNRNDMLFEEDFVIEEGELRIVRQPITPRRRNQQICVDPINQQTAPVGDYGDGFRIIFRDENGELRTYYFASDF